jgi:hypothetical protein
MYSPFNLFRIYLGRIETTPHPLFIIIFLARAAEYVFDLAVHFPYLSEILCLKEPAIITAMAVAVAVIAVLPPPPPASPAVTFAVSIAIAVAVAVATAPFAAAFS